jgi:hypothetical protein
MKEWINWGHRIEEIQIGHPAGSKRRWILVLSHYNVIEQAGTFFLMETPFRFILWAL